MNRFVAGTLVLAILLPAHRALAQTPMPSTGPSLALASPLAVKPGTTVDVRFSGGNLTGATQIWTSFPATGVLAPRIDKNGTEAGSVVYRLAIPADVPLGTGGVRVATGNGVSNLLPFLIDDLASVASTSGYTRESAQAITPPIAVDAGATPEASHFYKFTVTAGQRLAVDVMARRIGSKMDPIARLLDSAGHELAYADDDAAGGLDSRFAYKFTAAGDYFLEVRDVRYEGGSDHFYRLRIGDFPLPSVPFPVAVQKGTSAKVQVTGTEPGAEVVAVNMPPEVPADRMNVPMARAPGQGSSWVTLIAASGPEQLEREPNDAPETSTPVAVPGAIEGRFEVPGDRDYFQFEAKAGQRFRFRPQTRAVGSPSDMLLRLYKPDGSQMSESQHWGFDEGALDFDAGADGVYRLSVEELSGRGGPDFVYRIAVEPRTSRGSFSLSVDNEKIDVPQNGVMVLKVLCGRQGYDGPITLSVVGAGDGLIMQNNVIPQGQKEAALVLQLPPSLTAGQLRTVSIVGKAKIGDVEFETAATSLGPLRKAFGGLPFPPELLNGSIGLGVGPVFPDFFKIAAAQNVVTFVPPSGPGSFKVQATKMNGFDDKITLTVEGLPAGVTAKPAAIEKGQAEATIELASAQPVAAGRYPFKVTSVAGYQNQTRNSTLSDLALQVGPAIQVGIQPAGPLAVGGKQKITLSFAGELKAPPDAGTYQPGTTLGVDGPHTPDFLGLESDNRAIALSGIDKSPKDDHLETTFANLGTGNYSVEFWFFNSRDLNRPDAPPVSGYLFSRAGPAGPSPGGDHLGIGGTSPDTPRDKLFMFNGQAILKGDTPLSLNAWHHVILVREGEEVRVYLDGRIDLPEVRGKLPQTFNGAQMFFGTRSDDFGPFMGRLDEISVYRAALSPAQVHLHFTAATEAGSYRSTILNEAPVAYYRFGETEGQVAQNLATEDRLKMVALTWKNLPAGVTAPPVVSLGPGQEKIELELTAAPTAAPGKFDKIQVTANTKISGQDAAAESPPAQLEIVKP